LSNTIRRKNEAQNPWFFQQYVYQEGYIPRTGEKLKERQQEYHADWGRGHHKWGVRTWFRKNEERIFKSIAKQELIKYWKDPEYEVQIRPEHTCDRD
jgi:hypothetical protein